MVILHIVSLTISIGANTFPSLHHALNIYMSLDPELHLTDKFIKKLWHLFGKGVYLKYVHMYYVDKHVMWLGVSNPYFSIL